MRLTFRADRCGSWAEAADWAAAGGYDGVDVRFSFDPGEHAETNVHLCDPAKVRRALGEVRVSAVRFAVGGLPSTGIEPAVMAAVVAAGELGAAVVRLDDGPDVRGLSTDALRRLGDRAEAAGVAIAVAVGDRPGGAVAAWHRLDAVGHPAVGCGWEPGGDPPAVAVPLLNSRIRHVRLRRPPADADVRDALHRLAGIGYVGPVLVDWTGGTAMDAREALVEAAKQLRQ